MANFGSDNQAGAHPAIFEALQAEGQSFARPYGDDDVTERVQAQISACFERECEIFLVATGTAANALILSAMAPPWGGIYCHRDAHIANDENTAPEFYSGGCPTDPYPRGGGQTLH